MRIGQSNDIHRLVEGRELVLGGVRIPFEKGTLGHSDGDALTHSIIEAVIGALGLGDIGKFFPDNDPQYEGINSLILLDKIYEVMDEKGYQIGNVDSLIMIEKPKMKDYISEMRNNIAEHLHCSADRVNVKATTYEGLGPVGQQEAVLGCAVVLLEEKK